MAVQPHAVPDDAADAQSHTSSDSQTNSVTDTPPNSIADASTIGDTEQRADAIADATTFTPSDIVTLFRNATAEQACPCA